MDTSYYWWELGNGSCDCNRELYFTNWTDDDPDIQCGNTKYSIPRYIAEDGTVVEHIPEDEKDW